MEKETVTYYYETIDKEISNPKWKPVVEKVFKKFRTFDPMLLEQETDGTYKIKFFDADLEKTVKNVAENMVNELNKIESTWESITLLKECKLL